MGGTVTAKVKTPISNGKVYSFLQDHAKIKETEYCEDNVIYCVIVNRCFIHVLEKYGAEVKFDRQKDSVVRDVVSEDELVERVSSSDQTKRPDPVSNTVQGADTENTESGHNDHAA